MRTRLLLIGLERIIQVSAATDEHYSLWNYGLFRKCCILNSTRSENANCLKQVGLSTPLRNLAPLVLYEIVEHPQLIRVASLKGNLNLQTSTLQHRSLINEDIHEKITNLQIPEDKYAFHWPSLPALCNTYEMSQKGTLDNEGQRSCKCDS